MPPPPHGTSGVGTSTYFSMHKDVIEGVLNDVLCAVMAAEPANPARFMAEHFLAAHPVHESMALLKSELVSARARIAELEARGAGGSDALSDNSQRPSHAPSHRKHRKRPPKHARSARRTAKAGHGDGSDHREWAADQGIQNHGLAASSESNYVGRHKHKLQALMDAHLHATVSDMNEALRAAACTRPLDTELGAFVTGFLRERADHHPRGQTGAPTAALPADGTVAAPISLKTTMLSIRARAAGKTGERFVADLQSMLRAERKRARQKRQLFRQRSLQSEDWIEVLGDCMPTSGTDAGLYGNVEEAANHGVERQQSAGSPPKWMKETERQTQEKYMDHYTRALRKEERPLLHERSAADELALEQAHVSRWEAHAAQVCCILCSRMLPFASYRQAVVNPSQTTEVAACCGS